LAMLESPVVVCVGILPCRLYTSYQMPVVEASELLNRALACGLRPDICDEFVRFGSLGAISVRCRKFDPLRARPVPES
jgi:hypothetical protein